MNEDKYKEMYTWLVNHGQLDFAHQLFKVFHQNARLKGENVAYHTALTAGLAVHIHNNDGLIKRAAGPKIPSRPNVGLRDLDHLGIAD